MAFVLMILNILLILAILVAFYLATRWLITKAGIPVEVTYILLFIVAVVILIYLVQNGFPKLF